jgi:hypothetical protein
LPGKILPEKIPVVAIRRYDLKKSACGNKRIFRMPDTRYQYMVTRHKRRACRSQLLDNAGAFMPQDAARLAPCDIALEDMQVGSANRCLGYSDDGVGGRHDFRLGALFEEFFPWPLINESFHS